MITVITKPNCAECIRLKSQLDAKGIEYTTKDVMEVIEDLQKQGIMSVPVVVENGEYITNYKVK